MNIAHFWRICDQLCRWLSTRELWEALCKENSAFLRSERARKKWNFPESFCAYSAPLVIYRLPMVLPWAIFLLGLRPVIACNVYLCTMFRGGYLVDFALPLLVTVAVTQCFDGVIINNLANCISAKTGWKPNKLIARSIRPRYSWPSILRSERAKGREEKWYFPNSFCTYSALISYLPLTHGVTMGYILFGASPRHCL